MSRECCTVLVVCGSVQQVLQMTHLPVDRVTDSVLPA